MPHALSASRTDRGPSSASSSSTDPPEGTSTELYRPVGRSSDTPTAMPRAADSHELHHGRAYSYASEPDEHADADTRMPAPTHVQNQAASPPSLRRREQQHAVLSPSRPSSPGSSASAGAGQTTPTTVLFSSYHEASPPTLLPTSNQSPETASSSAFSHALPAHAAPSSHAHAPRTGIVDSSGYHYSTRTKAPQLLPPSPPAPPRQPLQRRSPHVNHQRTSNVTEAAPTTTTAMPLLPAPLDTASAPSSTSQQAATRAAAAVPAADVRAVSHVSNTAHWQLNSPESHRHCNDGHVDQRGAVFEYASEAVTTLEQQYGDALQRLNTMHRLYDRLDAHNRTLASELKRVRQVSDVLQNGVAFQLYNSVRHVKHEMRLLKQYVELLSSNFSNQLHVLQQVVGEELQHLLGRHDSYTSLLPHGAEGRLQPTETRVSIGAARGRACSLERIANVPSSELGGHVTGAGGGVGAGTQFYSQDYWWNVMSPHPIRPPSGAHTPAAPAELEAGGWADVGSGRGRGATEHKRALSPPDQLPLSMDDSRENNLSTQSSGEGLVSRHAYREVQEALADAQRRVVELERASSNQQADYENRIAQLKAAHRAKEATLKEELALQRRRAELAQDGEPQQAALSTRLPGQAAGLTSPVDVNQLVQLLLEHRYQQPTAKQHPDASPTTSSPTSTVQPPRQASHKAVRPPLQRCGDADETAGQKDSRHDSADTSAITNDSDSDFRRRAAHPCATESASASNTDDGNGDVRLSFDRTKRCALRAIASKGSGRRRTGADGDLHMPDRYSPTAAARRVERAREVLGGEERDGERRQEGQRVHSSTSSGNRRQREVAATEAAGATTTATVQRSLAYERLMDHSRAASRSLEGYAPHNGRPAARAGPRTVSNTDAPSVPRRSSSRRWQRIGGAARDPRHVVGVGPELLESLLAQVDAVDVQGGSQYAVTAPKRVRPVQSQLGPKVDRVAQGIWAEKLLKERSCL